MSPDVVSAAVFSRDQLAQRGALQLSEFRQLGAPFAEFRPVAGHQRHDLEYAVVDGTGEPLAFGERGLPAYLLGLTALGPSGDQQIRAVQCADGAGREQQSHRGGGQVVNRVQVAGLR